MPRLYSPPLLSCIVVLSLLTLVPPGAAQFGQEDVAVTGKGSLVLPDRSGDVGPLTEMPEATPIGTLFQHIDIQDLTIDNDQTTSVDVTFRLQGRDPTMTTAADAASFGNWGCFLDFILNDEADLRYQLEVTGWGNLGSMGTADPELDGRLEIWDYRGGGWDWDRHADAVAVHYDTSVPGIVATIDKAYLWTGASDAPPAKGDRMTSFDAYCAASLGLFGTWRDSLSARASEFHFVDPGAGDVVSVHFDDRMPEIDIEDLDSWSRPTSVAFAPGEASTVPFIVKNEAEAKRIVKLTPSVIDAEGTPQPWNLTMVPSLEMRSGEARVVKLVAVPPADLGSGADLRLQVDLDVIGVDAPGRAQRAIEVVPLLSAAQDTLWFHAQERTGFGPAAEHPADALFKSYDLAVSVGQELEGYDDEPVEIFFRTSEWSSFEMAPLAKAVRFDPEDTMRLTLDFEADGPATVWYDLWLGNEAVGTVVAAAGEAAADAPLVVERPLAEDMVELAAGTRLEGWLYLSHELEVGEPQPEVRWDPKASSLRLPITEVAEEEVVVTDGRFLPSLALTEDEDREEYVNPGKATTWEMVLANDGVESDDLRVTLDLENATKRGWSASVEPGHAFRVPAGNATPFGVTLRAPADAPEGDVVNVTVKAVSTHDAEASTTLRLRAIVTDGVAIEDETYGEKEGQLAPLAETEESPGPAAFLWLGLGLAMVLARRRR